MDIVTWKCPTLQLSQYHVEFAIMLSLPFFVGWPCSRLRARIGVSFIFHQCSIYVIHQISIYLYRHKICDSCCNILVQNIFICKLEVIHTGSSNFLKHSWLILGVIKCTCIWHSLFGLWWPAEYLFHWSTFFATGQSTRVMIEHHPFQDAAICRCTSKEIEGLGAVRGLRLGRRQAWPRNLYTNLFILY